jgi:NAD(P)-dependent dehydrogenase (short-subunit alcohol dehydrogenase family)
LEVPWFFAEHYLYRRVLEAVDYFAAEGERGPDPFAPQKKKALTNAANAINRLARRWRQSLEEDAPWAETMAHLIRTDLWGNQGDLSMWPAGRENDPDDGAAEERTLVDDTAVAIDHLRGGVERIDVLIDNAGFELVADLALAAYLLATDTAVTLRLHAKLHPVFVSDAAIPDVKATIDFLATSDEAATRALGKRLQTQRENGRLRLRTHPFWTSPLPGWELAPDLRHELLLSNLVISKGDAHYRRLLGDRHWPYTMPFADIVSYFPAPLLALRTLKSEVAAGIPPERLRQAEQTDPDWLFSGEWGVIQMKA